MKKVILLLLLVCGIFLFFLIGTIYFPKVQKITADKFAHMTFKEGRSYWQSRIHAAGSAEAYSEFSEVIHDFNAFKQHDAAHVFGDALYGEAGLSGIAVCDGQFLYGCFHAFAIRGIEEGGIANAKEMNAACISALGATADQCQHGIGHGILGTLGYTLADLKEALNICDTLSASLDKVSGCHGGVFMEFNMHSMLADKQSKFRTFHVESILEPCASLDADIQAACSYWLPMWWTVVHPNKQNHELVAQEMGRWCQLLPGGRPSLQLCIKGAANRIQILTDDDVAQTQKICALLTSNPALQYDCQLASAIRFIYFHPLTEALGACEGLSKTQSSLCKSKATEKTAKRRADKNIRNLPTNDDTGILEI